MPLLIIWFFVNIAALLLFIHIAETSINYADPFIYPKIDEWLAKEEVGGLGNIIVKILFTMFFLPALLVYFLLTIIVSLLALMVIGLYNAIKKLRNK